MLDIPSFNRYIPVLQFSIMLLDIVEVDVSPPSKESPIVLLEMVLFIIIGFC